MRWFLITLGAILLILAFSSCAYLVNQKLTPYDGYASAFMAGLGVFTTLVNLLYRRNQAIYLFLNRVFLFFERKHSTWMADFEFRLKASQTRNVEAVIDCVADVFLSEPKWGAVIRSRMADKLEIIVAEVLGLEVRVSDRSLHLNLDRKVEVPSSLYERRARLLRSIAERIEEVINPTKIQCTLEIFFREGTTNPFYGYFVNNVPVGHLEDFRVLVNLGEYTDSRIKADREHVGVESTRISEGFEAMNCVLYLRAIPMGAAK